MCLSDTTGSHGKIKKERGREGRRDRQILGGRERERERVGGREREYERESRGGGILREKQGAREIASIERHQNREGGRYQ